MESLQRINLYVTYVEKEGPFLKLWGQTDKNNALFVEQFLAGFATQFDIGVGKVSPELIPPGTLICAKYKDNKYYRAKILNSVYVREGSLEVNFIDFGNKGVVSSDSIRSVQSFPPSIVTVSPLAIGFIFAEAHCVGGGEWNDAIFESIAKEIKYREVVCTLLAQATSYYLVRISVEGSDLCGLLTQRGLMQPISLQAQQAVLLSMSMQKLGTQSQSQTATTISNQINTYKACTLEPGCQYPVYVSYVNDGPCHFSVQLKQTEDVLVMLMNDINSINLRLLEDIPIPGTICLARCIEDNNICRAVVTNEVDAMFKVFYVDFGNFEVLPVDSLFQIPFKYVIPKVMAIRFALAGIEKPSVTTDMQVAFKKFVDNRLLHLKVLPSPTRTAIPKCELWDPETKTSALDLVIRSAKHSYPEPVALTRGFSQPIKVSYVYSCSRFYVQLINKESELISLMNELQALCEVSDLLDPNSIKVGVPCCALFSGDGLWYRSQIVEIMGDIVKVRYIDYGNEESVPAAQLKSITGEILTILRPQAIESCLNGYQNMDPDAERDLLLEELILEGVFTMKVVEMFDKKTLVDLFDSSNYNVASLLLDKLAAAKSQISPVLAVQAGNKIEHRKSFAKPRDQQNYNKSDRNYNSDKGERPYNTGREHKSWDKPNDRNERNEKSWRQDNRENRNYDKNTNENNETNSWRDSNKGFSPNKRFDKTRKQDDSWNTTNNATNNNSDWGDNAQKSPETNAAWEKNTNSNTAQDSWNTQGGNDDWSKNANNVEDSRPKRNDFRGGYNNDRGGRFEGKSRDGGYKKRDFKKDGSEMSSSGSEKSFQKGPRSSSRNDNRGRGGHNFDKPRNSTFGGNKGGGGDSWNVNSTTEDSWNVSAVTSTIDAAPATATFVNYDVVGSEGNIVISWFHNPSLFYCQQVCYQESFKALMEEICEFYKDKKCEQVVKGAPIIALFDEDKVLYRARVLEVIGTQYKVHYVDFGNVSTVSKVYPIEKKFMDLPSQAIPCALNGIAPIGDQWADADSYSSYFDKDSFLCHFVNKDEEKTYVNIFLDLKDIGQLLVNDGLAVSTASTIPEIDIPLLLGQQFRATVKSVNNLSDIILALECSLAVNCTMHNLESATETFEDILKGLLEQAVIVYVDNVLEDYRLEITLYDLEGNKHIVLNPDDGAFETVDIPCPILVLQPIITGYVSFADETSVFIQPIEYADLVTSLLDQLFEEYDGKAHENTIIPEEGMLYVVHSEDGNWYRGKVISFDDEKATVVYIDYGNSEDIGFVELRELETKFLDIPILSLQVTVGSGVADFVDKDVSATIYYGESGWEGTIQVLEQSSTALATQVDITESAESTDIGLATSSMEKPVETVGEDIADVLESEPIFEPEISADLIGNPVLMSHIDSPSDFYLQFYETVNEIEEIQAELQEKVEEMEVLENPVPGVLCAAPYSADQQWYRAEVLDADEDITTVRFVDFGNTDVIDNKTTKVKTLPPKLLTLDIYATRCALKIQPVEEEWSSTSLAVFEQLSMGENLRAEFLEQNEKCTYVELYLADVNIKDALIQENLAKVFTITTEGRQTGFVSHLNSPTEFWIQLESCVDELEWIAEQLSAAESFPELEDLNPGTLCAALFPDDQMWYRARILSNTVAGIELLFIDYGNSCTSSSLRQLPEDLIMTAPLALKCSLQKNEGVPTWSPEAAAKFEEISAGGQTIFTVKKISTGETSIVQLLLDGQDVTTMLLPVTEEGLVKEVKSFDKLSIEKESGEELTEVALEPLEGQTLGEEAKEKFEELNNQGTTRFQIEFINEKTVRLYLNGRDIRPLLGSFKNPSNTEEVMPDDANTVTSIELLHVEQIVPDNETSTEHVETNINNEKHDISIQKDSVEEPIEVNEISNNEDLITEENLEESIDQLSGIQNEENYGINDNDVKEKGSLEHEESLEHDQLVELKDEENSNSKVIFSEKDCEVSSSNTKEILLIHNHDIDKDSVDPILEIQNEENCVNDDDVKEKESQEDEKSLDQPIEIKHEENSNSEVIFSEKDCDTKKILPIDDHDIDKDLVDPLLGIQNEENCGINEDDVKEKESQKDEKLLNQPIEVRDEENSNSEVIFSEKDCDVSSSYINETLPIDYHDINKDLFEKESIDPLLEIQNEENRGINDDNAKESLEHEKSLDQPIEVKDETSSIEVFSEKDCEVSSSDTKKIFPINDHDIDKGLIEKESIDPLLGIQNEENCRINNDNVKENESLEHEKSLDQSIEVKDEENSNSEVIFTEKDCEVSSSDIKEILCSHDIDLIEKESIDPLVEMHNEENCGIKDDEVKEKESQEREKSFDQSIEVKDEENSNSEVILSEKDCEVSSSDIKEIFPIHDHHPLLGIQNEENCGINDVDVKENESLEDEKSLDQPIEIKDKDNSYSEVIFTEKNYDVSSSDIKEILPIHDHDIDLIKKGSIDPLLGIQNEENCGIHDDIVKEKESLEDEKSLNQQIEAKHEKNSNSEAVFSEKKCEISSSDTKEIIPIDIEKEYPEYNKELTENQIIDNCDIIDAEITDQIKFEENQINPDDVKETEIKISQIVDNTLKSPIYVSIDSPQPALLDTTENKDSSLQSDTEENIVKDVGKINMNALSSPIEKRLEIILIAPNTKDLSFCKEHSDTSLENSIPTCDKLETNSPEKENFNSENMAKEVLKDIIDLASSESQI